MLVYGKLLKVRDEKGAGFLVLLDPDRMGVSEIVVTNREHKLIAKSTATTIPVGKK